jgi:hypothetical protein
VVVDGETHRGREGIENPQEMLDLPRVDAREQDHVVDVLNDGARSVVGERVYKWCPPASSMIMWWRSSATMMKR